MTTSETTARAADTATTLTRALTRLVLSGELPAGAQLKTSELAERFATSRVPIREALRELSAIGLATYLPNRGFRVASLSAAQAVEIVEVRLLLEPEAAARAAVLATSAEIDELYAVVGRGEAATAARRHAEATLAHHSFLIRLAGAAHHDQLAATLRPLHQRTMLVFHGWHRDYDGWQGHRLLTDAVAAHDARAAAEAARQHLSSIRSTLAARAAEAPPRSTGAVMRRAAPRVAVEPREARGRSGFDHRPKTDRLS